MNRSDGELIGSIVSYTLFVLDVVTIITLIVSLTLGVMSVLERIKGNANKRNTKSGSG